MTGVYRHGVISGGALRPVLVCFHKLEIAPLSNFNYSRDGTGGAADRRNCVESQRTFGTHLHLTPVFSELPGLHPARCRQPHVVAGVSGQSVRRFRTGTAGEIGRRAEEKLPEVRPDPQSDRVLATCSLNRTPAS